MGSEKFRTLYKKYPELLSDNTTIDCDEGLYAIIEEMLIAIKTYQDVNLGTTSLIPTVINFIEIKFGVLNIDYSGGDELVQHVVNFAKKISFKTCELCGNIGELYCSTRWLHWSHKKTLCKQHAIEYFYYTLH